MSKLKKKVEEQSKKQKELEESKTILQDHLKMTAKVLEKSKSEKLTKEINDQLNETIEHMILEIDNPRKEVTETKEPLTVTLKTMNLGISTTVYQIKWKYYKSQLLRRSYYIRHWIKKYVVTPTCTPEKQVVTEVVHTEGTCTMPETIVQLDENIP